MPDAAPASCHLPAAPPVDALDHHHHDHQDALPDDAPPSYDDAVGMRGAPPGYGTLPPYTDDSSTASSEVETNDRALPEWLGQFLAIFILICLLYGFWQFVNTPDMPSGERPGKGRLGPPST